MNERLRMTSDDVLDEASRQGLSSVLVIGITHGNALVISTNLNLGEAIDLAELVANGHAVPQATPEYIRTLDA
jgi:hypothetical protein